MQTAEAADRIQAAYPKIYLACHGSHKQPGRVNRRNGTILAHIPVDRPIRQIDLQQHLGLAKSTLSEALTALEEEGLVRRIERMGVALTPKGAEFKRGGSVLEWSRLTRLLDTLSEDDRRAAVAGLEILSAAAVASGEVTE